MPRRNVQLVVSQLLDRGQRLPLECPGWQPRLPGRGADQLELDPDQPVRLDTAGQVLQRAAALPETSVLPHLVEADRERRRISLAFPVGGQAGRLRRVPASLRRAGKVDVTPVLRGRPVDNLDPAGELVDESGHRNLLHA